MKQKLLTDIELDVHELKCLMDSYAKEPTLTLSELLKRSARQMQTRLDLLLEQLESAQKNIPIIETQDSSVVEEDVIEETEEAEEIEETRSVIANDNFLVEAKPKPWVLGENIKMSAGLRQSISLNDSFRFSRELFGGDVELMNRVIEQISVMSSYKASVAFLSSKVNINEENESLNDLLELLKKYFNKTV